MSAAICDKGNACTCVKGSGNKQINMAIIIIGRLYNIIYTGLIGKELGRWSYCSTEWMIQANNYNWWGCENLEGFHDNSRLKYMHGWSRRGLAIQFYTSTFCRCIVRLAVFFTVWKWKIPWAGCCSLAVVAWTVASMSLVHLLQTSLQSLYEWFKEKATRH